MRTERLPNGPVLLSELPMITAFPVHYSISCPDYDRKESPLVSPDPKVATCPKCKPKVEDERDKQRKFFFGK
jgi:hypothetical protein